MNFCKVLKLEKSPLGNVYFPNIMPSLSKSQRNVLEIAYRNGYYKYPRKKSLQELAKIAKVSVSTFQEHLRKAEIKLFPALIEKNLHGNDTYV